MAKSVKCIKFRRVRGRRRIPRSSRLARSFGVALGRLYLIRAVA